MGKAKPLWAMLRLRPEIVDRLRAYCAGKGKTMGEVAAEAIAAYLKRRGA